MTNNKAPLIKIKDFLSQQSFDMVDQNEADLLIDVLEKLISKPEPEPVVYRFETHNGYAYSNEIFEGENGEPLYTKPQYTNERAEEYAGVLRSLAFYLGSGGYNADDPINAKVFEEKIRSGIDGLIDRINDLQGR